MKVLCRRTELELPEHLLMQLCDAAPYALAMLNRSLTHRRQDEAAKVFTPVPASHVTMRNQEEQR